MTARRWSPPLRGASWGYTTTVAFTGLKLAGLVDWTWWTVIAPIWAGPVLWVAAVAIVAAAESGEVQR